MISTIGDIAESIIDSFHRLSSMISMDMLFIIALAVEAVIAIFFLVKSEFSYEATLNRALEKLNMWLFEKKMVTEENIRDLNLLFKTKAPKRVCYYWQQYILFREANPSEYLSTENLIEKPLKTSSVNSNIKNFSLISTVWAGIVALFILALYSTDNTYLYVNYVTATILVPILTAVVAVVFTVFLRARKNSILNSLYQNVSLFGRFMDNACIDLPTYIDYQILFTPQEIEKGQPVLREFLDYKARKEKEEFNKAKEEQVDYEAYDFSATGVDGSIVLDRAMKESELFMKKKEKILVKISQLEAELDSRKKNFDNVQKDYQTKIQASKENVARLRQMQEETTNRIESNYYRKQQTQEIGKQEQFEQEFEQLRAKYLLEKNEGEEEIQKLNDELEKYKKDVEVAMIGEYQTFFDKFCQSAEKVVSKVFGDRINGLKDENTKNKQYITELEIKLKNVPQGEYDASATEKSEPVQAEGQYDEQGNYVYPNGTYYDPQGNFHDEKGNVYSQDGKLISEAPQAEEKLDEKKVVNFDDFDSFDFMTDTTQKGDVYDVAEKIIDNVDTENQIEVINNAEKNDPMKDFVLEEQTEPVEEKAEPQMEEFKLDEVEQPKQEETVEEKPKKKAGRPRKVKVEQQPVAKKRGRPRKVVEEISAPVKKVGRPRKVKPEEKVPEPEKKKVGRPKKIVKEEPAKEEVKRGRGRPKKQIESIVEINKKLSKEEAKLQKMRKTLNKELESAMNGMDNVKVDDKQAHRDELLKQIDALQKEAQAVVKQNESEKRIAEINSKLESLLNEIKNLN